MRSRLLQLFALTVQLGTAAVLFAAETPIVLRSARMLDPAQDRIVSPGLVVVRGNKVEAIGGTAPQDATVIDLGDTTLLPGLIDAHVHVLLQGDVTTEDYDVQLFKESLAYRALRASRSVKIGLENGFTTMRDLETEGAMYTDVDVKKAINKGVIPGPRLIVSTRAMSVTGGYGPSGYAPGVTYPMGVQIVDGVDECIKAVREQIANGADWIKVYADRAYFVTPEGKLSSIPTFTRAEMKAIIDETHRLGHKVAAHAMARPGIENALMSGVDSIEHGISIDDDLLEFMAAHQVFLCPTLTVTEYVAPGRAAEGRDIWAKIPMFHRDSFSRALRHGVPIAFGTDVGGFPWDINEAREFGYETANGMTPLQAIRSATSAAARLLGMQGKIGTLAPGAFADVIAVPGNPFDDIHTLEHVVFVMKDGKIYKSASH